jgi:hypothetical protein
VAATRRTRERRRAWLIAALAGLSAALLFLLAVATNWATSAVPADWKRWTSDPEWTWGATAGLAIAVVVVAVLFQRLSAPLKDDRRGEVSGGEGEGPGTSAPSCIGSASNLPARSRVFVGRADLLDKIQQGLEKGRVAVVAVHGLRGLGKSAIALEFAHRGYEAGRFSIAWWIRGESAVTLVEDLADLAPTLGLAEAFAAEAEVVAGSASREGVLIEVARALAEAGQYQKAESVTGSIAGTGLRIL